MRNGDGAHRTRRAACRTDADISSRRTCRRDDITSSSSHIDAEVSGAIMHCTDRRAVACNRTGRKNVNVHASRRCARRNIKAIAARSRDGPRDVYVNNARAFSKNIDRIASGTGNRAARLNIQRDASGPGRPVDIEDRRRTRTPDRKSAFQRYSCRANAVIVDRNQRAGR